jgi:2-methylaconitate cis-trans-isomerase PrpF
MKHFPLTLITVEVCGDPADALGAFRVMSGMIADAVDETRRTGRPVAELRIGAVLVGRVIVSSVDARDGLRADLTDPDRYMGSGS